MDHQALDNIIYHIISGQGDPSKSFSSVCPMKTLLDLLETIQTILSEEPTVLSLQSNIHVVGDVHGNINDLIRIFEMTGYPPITKYLFLGDYVDRGENSLEVIALLFALKAKYPKHVYMIRGNHEIERISSIYGFYDEISKKYTTRLYGEMTNTFYYLPICAVIQDTIFCVHGGIGPNTKDLSEIKELPKPEDIGSDGAFVDMLWSDPRNMPDSPLDFVPSKRGSGYYFSEKAVDQFLAKNKLSYMIRSHELCLDGYSCTFHNDKCITIFSNTNYCSRRNSAAIAYVDTDCRTEIITLPYLNEKQISKRVPTLPHWLIDSYPMSHSGSQPELVETGETSKYDNYIGRSMLGSVSPIDDSQQTLRERETFSLYKMLLYS